MRALPEPSIDVSTWNSSPLNFLLIHHLKAL